MRKRDLQSGLKDKSHIGSGPHESYGKKMNEDWIKVENFIDKDMAQLLYGYVLLAHRRLSVMKQMNYKTSLFGWFKDNQAYGDYSKYGDLIFDTLLLGKREQLEEITKLISSGYLTKDITKTLRLE